MKFAINAYEQIYGGLHGINNQFVIEADSEEEAKEAAETASYEVIISYSSIMEGLEESIERDTIGDNEYDEMIEEAIMEDIEYEIFEIESDLSIKELNEMAFEDFEELIEKYRKDAK